MESREPVSVLDCGGLPYQVQEGFRQPVESYYNNIAEQRINNVVQLPYNCTNQDVITLNNVYSPKVFYPDATKNDRHHPVAATGLLLSQQYLESKVSVYRQDLAGEEIPHNYIDVGGSFRSLNLPSHTCHAWCAKDEQRCVIAQYAPSSPAEVRELCRAALREPSSANHCRLGFGNCDSPAKMAVMNHVYDVPLEELAEGFHRHGLDIMYVAMFTPEEISYGTHGWNSTYHYGIKYEGDDAIMYFDDTNHYYRHRRSTWAQWCDVPAFVGRRCNLVLEKSASFGPVTLITVTRATTAGLLEMVIPTRKSNMREIICLQDNMKQVIIAARGYTPAASIRRALHKCRRVYIPDYVHARLMAFAWVREDNHFTRQQVGSYLRALSQRITIGLKDIQEGLRLDNEEFAGITVSLFLEAAYARQMATKAIGHAIGVMKLDSDNPFERACYTISWWLSSYTDCHEFIRNAGSRKVRDLVQAKQVELMFKEGLITDRQPEPIPRHQPIREFFGVVPRDGTCVSRSVSLLEYGHPSGYSRMPDSSKRLLTKEEASSLFPEHFQKLHLEDAHCRPILNNRDFCEHSIAFEPMSVSEERSAPPPDFELVYDLFEAKSYFEYDSSTPKTRWKLNHLISMLPGDSVNFACSAPGHDVYVSTPFRKVVNIRVDHGLVDVARFPVGTTFDYNRNLCCVECAHNLAGNSIYADLGTSGDRDSITFRQLLALRSLNATGKRFVLKLQRFFELLCRPSAYRNELLDELTKLHVFQIPGQPNANEAYVSNPGSNYQWDLQLINAYFNGNGSDLIDKGTIFSMPQIEDTPSHNDSDDDTVSSVISICDEDVVSISSFQEEERQVYTAPPDMRTPPISRASSMHELQAAEDLDESIELLVQTATDRVEALLGEESVDVTASPAETEIEAAFWSMDEVTPVSEETAPPPAPPAQSAPAPSIVTTSPKVPRIEPLTHTMDKYALRIQSLLQVLEPYKHEGSELPYPRPTTWVAFRTDFHGGETTITIEDKLLQQVVRNGDIVLNCASTRLPGGGWRGSSLAQEEWLARTTNLLASLEQEYGAPDICRKHYARCDRNYDSVEVIVSENCTQFFREQFDSTPNERKTYDIVSSAAPNLGCKYCRKYSKPALEDLWYRKWCSLLSTANRLRGRRLILSGWGMGVFKNAPETVFAAFNKAVATGVQGLDEIIFCLPTDYPPRKEINTKARLLLHRGSFVPFTESEKLFTLYGVPKEDRSCCDRYLPEKIPTWALASDFDGEEVRFYGKGQENGILSNFYATNITFRGELYTCNETAYQRFKHSGNSRKFADPGDAWRDAKKNKRYFCCAYHAMVLMSNLLEVKAAASPTLRNFLKPGKQYVEYCDHTFWGRKDGKGSNILGKMWSNYANKDEHPTESSSSYLNKFSATFQPGRTVISYGFKSAEVDDALMAETFFCSFEHSGFSLSEKAAISSTQEKCLPVVFGIGNKQDFHYVGAAPCQLSKLGNLLRFCASRNADLTVDLTSAAKTLGLQLDHLASLCARALSGKLTVFAPVSKGCQDCESLSCYAGEDKSRAGNLMLIAPPMATVPQQTRVPFKMSDARVRALLKICRGTLNNRGEYAGIDRVANTHITEALESTDDLSLDITIGGYTGAPGSGKTTVCCQKYSPNNTTVIAPFRKLIEGYREKGFRGVTHIKAINKDQNEIVLMDEVFALAPGVFVALLHFNREASIDVIGDPYQMSHVDERRVYGGLNVSDLFDWRSLAYLARSFTVPIDVCRFLNKTTYKDRPFVTYSQVINSVEFCKGGVPKSTNAYCYTTDYGRRNNFTTVASIQGVRTATTHLAVESCASQLLRTVPAQTVVAISRHSLKLKLYMSVTAHRIYFDIKPITLKGHTCKFGGTTYYQNDVGKFSAAQVVFTDAPPVLVPGSRKARIDKRFTDKFGERVKVLVQNEGEKVTVGVPQAARASLDVAGIMEVDTITTYDHHDDQNKLTRFAPKWEKSALSIDTRSFPRDVDEILDKIAPSESEIDSNLAGFMHVKFEPARSKLRLTCDSGIQNADLGEEVIKTTVKPMLRMRGRPCSARDRSQLLHCILRRYAGKSINMSAKEASTQAGELFEGFLKLCKHTPPPQVTFELVAQCYAEQLIRIKSKNDHVQAGEYDLSVKEINTIKGFLKSQTKKDLAPNSFLKSDKSDVKAGQGISQQSKTVNLMVGSLVRAVEICLKNHLRSTVLLGYGNDPAQLSEIIKQMSIPKNKKALEVDVKEFDSQRGLWTDMYMDKVYELFGIDHARMSYMTELNKNWELDCGNFRLNVEGHFQSGRADTLLSNTIVSMGFFGAYFDWQRLHLALFQGDDVAVIGDQVVQTVNKPFLKPLETNCPSFCSYFVDDGLVIDIASMCVKLANRTFENDAALNSYMLGVRDWLRTASSFKTHHKALLLCSHKHKVNRVEAEKLYSFLHHFAYGSFGNTVQQTIDRGLCLRSQTHPIVI